MYSIDKTAQLNSYNLHGYLIQLCFCLVWYVIWPSPPSIRMGWVHV